MIRCSKCNKVTKTYEPTGSIRKLITIQRKHRKPIKKLISSKYACSECMGENYENSQN